MHTFYPGFDEKRREGKGVQKVAVQNRVEKSIKSMLFRVRLFVHIQGARSRGWERFLPDLTNPVLRVLEDPQDRSTTLAIWRFAATLLSKG